MALGGRRGDGYCYPGKRDFRVRRHAWRAIQSWPGSAGTEAGATELQAGRGCRQAGAELNKGETMAPPAVPSSFDVAYWFIDRALDDNEYLQPQKMHRLMYLAQAYFAVAYHGRMLMPAVFVADEFGPIEPNVFRACAIQRPAVEAKALPDVVTHFLDGVWRRFGHHSAEYLNRQVNSHPPYGAALAAGAGSEITLKAMVAFYGKKAPAMPEESAAPAAPPVDQVLRPRMMRSQDGSPVAVQKWTPPVKAPGK
jgi:uncharacterized phage-associated protein